MSGKDLDSIVGMVDIIMEIALLFAKHSKDGMDWSHAGKIAGEIMANEDLKNRIREASSNEGQIPAEIKDLDFQESCDIACRILPSVARLVKTLSNTTESRDTVDATLSATIEGDLKVSENRTKKTSCDPLNHLDSKGDIIINNGASNLRYGLTWGRAFNLL